VAGPSPELVEQCDKTNRVARSTFRLILEEAALFARCVPAMTLMEPRNRCRGFFNRPSTEIESPRIVSPHLSPAATSFLQHLSKQDVNAPRSSLGDPAMTPQKSFNIAS
jgi:hypothetical protein